MTKDDVIQIIKEYLGQNGFTARKVTDMPTDALQIVPRKYVTRSFTTVKRPTTSILGESYFDTTVNKPVFWNGTSYKDAAGNVIS
jgi:hypothetical protein